VEEADFKYALILEYLGTEFNGFQYQPDLRLPRGKGKGPRVKKVATVQGKLMSALSTTLSTDVKTLRMRAASRTDAGVHAHGQVVSFHSPKRILTDDSDKDRSPSTSGPSGSIDGAKLVFKLNQMLPSSVRVLWLGRVSDSFHVQGSVALKQYNYYVRLMSQSHDEDPFTCETRHQLSTFKLGFSLERVRRAAAAMEGTHDWTAFSNNANEEYQRRTMREVTRCRCFLDASGFCIQVQAKGFLYKQVRHMAGALLMVGTGQLKEEAIEEALRDGAAFVARGKRVWKPAPAAGLHLMWIKYEPMPDDGKPAIPLPHQVNVN